MSIFIITLSSDRIKYGLVIILHDVIVNLKYALEVVELTGSDDPKVPPPVRVS